MLSRHLLNDELLFQSVGEYNVLSANRSASWKHLREAHKYDQEKFSEVMSKSALEAQVRTYLEAGIACAKSRWKRVWHMEGNARNSI